MRPLTHAYAHASNIHLHNSVFTFPHTFFIKGHEDLSCIEAMPALSLLFELPVSRMQALQDTSVTGDPGHTHQ